MDDGDNNPSTKHPRERTMWTFDFAALPFRGLRRAVLFCCYAYTIRSRYTRMCGARTHILKHRVVDEPYMFAPLEGAYNIVWWREIIYNHIARSCLVLKYQPEQRARCPRLRCLDYDGDALCLCLCNIWWLVRRRNTCSDVITFWVLCRVCVCFYII